MPAFFTHKVLAGKVLEKLPTEIFNQITSQACFYTGAQGADPFFLYNPFRKKQYNLGRIMHNKNIYEFFSNCKKNVCKNSREADYVYGYITHYAVDTVFHPYVYALEKSMRHSLSKRRKKDKLHFLIERDIDCFLFEEYENIPLKNYSYPIVLDDKDYFAIFRILEEVLWQTYSIRADYDSIRNSIARFVKQQKFFLDETGIKRKIFYFLETLFFAPHILSYICVRDNPDPKTANYLREGNGENIYDLAEKSIDLSVRLIVSFIKEKSLDKNLFSTDFNVGKDI